MRNPFLPFILGSLPKRSPTPPEVQWFPFTVTVGDSGDWVGFSSGDIASPPFNPPVGTISNEPTTLTSLAALYLSSDDNSLHLIFAHDVQAEMADLSITIEGAVYSPPTVDMFAGYTRVVFAGYEGSFSDGDTYAVVLGTALPQWVIEGSTERLIITSMPTPTIPVWEAGVSQITITAGL